MKNKLVMETVDILRKAKKMYESGRYSGMCACIYEAIDECITSNEFKEFAEQNIQLFCHPVAVEKFGATGSEDTYWWNNIERKIRLYYFDWLIEQYSKKD